MRDLGLLVLRLIDFGASAADLRELNQWTELFAPDFEVAAEDGR